MFATPDFTPTSSPMLKYLVKLQNKLADAKTQLDEVNAVKAELRARYDGEVAKKQELADAAAKTRKKMDQANNV